MTLNKPRLVLIRGLLREQRHWGEFTHILQAKFPDTKIITLDIPGNGCLNLQTSPNTIAELTDALRGQIIEPENLNLIAISMGGMIALDWMNRYPSEIKSAVLINTSVRPYSAFFHRLRWTVYPSIIKMLWHSATEREQLILSLTSNHHSRDARLIDQWQLWQSQNPVSLSSALNQLLAAAKFSVKSKPLHPILIIASKKDRLVDYRCSLKLQTAWETDYLQHMTAGHDLPLDDPHWLTQEIYFWIKNI